MKFLCLLHICIYFLSTTSVLSQDVIKDFGFRHLQLKFEDILVDVIVHSKKGEEHLKKPLFIFCQGSLAIPLITFNDTTVYPPVPFSRKLLEDEYHLVVIGKPGIPVAVHLDSLNRSREFVSKKSGLPPRTYTEQNHLDFFVERNNYVVNQLIKKVWVDTTKIVVAGHSEGSSIAAKMAASNTAITHLIYSGGTPYFSRILSQIRQDRKKESASKSMTEASFSYWEDVVLTPYDTSRDHGWNAYKGTFQFSESASENLKRISIPTLVSYGTKDIAAPFNDMLRVESIFIRKENIEFKVYLGLEHNYFLVEENGKVNYEKFGWDKTLADWLKWIAKNDPKK